jgi:hypothetical protein
MLDCSETPRGNHTLTNDCLVGFIQSPLHNLLDHRDQALPKVCQTVFDFGRHHGILLAMNEPALVQLLQLATEEGVTGFPWAATTADLLSSP